MDYKLINETEAPIEVIEWLNEHKYRENHTVIQGKEMTYVVITMGEKNTGGYDINVIEIMEIEDKILIKIKYIQPNRDQVVILILTYPFIIIEIEKTNKNIELEIEKDNLA